MSLSVGIVGLPNVGKSTLFNALLRKEQAFAANYPFATIDPNVGVVPVPDIRLDKLAEIIEISEKGTKPPIVPATVTFIDIAGLVEGAHKGEGLGNKFLANIREVDLICHVVRFFQDNDIHHVSGKVDPMRDKEIVESELILADIQTLEKQREPKGVSSKEEKERWVVVQKLISALNEGNLASGVNLTKDEQKYAKELNLLTTKSIIIVANVSEEELGNKDIMETSSAVLQLGAIPISAKIEEEMAHLTLEEQEEYLSDLGVSGSGLERLIKVAYDRLGLISFLTAGEKEVRAWKVTSGTTAKEASGTIHTDFAKNFIKAEVVDYETFINLGGWKKCFELGKVRLEGRDYIVKDGDVITFKVNA